MATSGSTNFSTTRDNLINGALRLVGAIGQGETGTAAQISEAADTLNMMVKGFMNYGMPLWAVKTYSGTLTDSVAGYPIGLGKTWNTAKPLKIYNAYIHDTVTGVDVPLNIISRQEYLQFSNKASSGTPVNIYYETNNDSGTIYTYPTPNTSVAANKTISIVYQRPFEDFDVSTDNPDFPQEWYEVIKYGLATRLAGEYGLERFSRKQLLAEFQFLFANAQGFNQEEVSLYFSPSSTFS